jgi:hypothetical protein
VQPAVVLVHDLTALTKGAENLVLGPFLGIVLLEEVLFMSNVFFWVVARRL